MPVQMNVFTIFKRLLRYLGQYKYFYLLAVVFMLSRKGAHVAMTNMLKPIINGLATDPNYQELVKQCIVLALLGLIVAISHLICNQLLISVSLKTSSHLRTELFKHMQKLPLSYFHKHDTGFILSTYVNDIVQVDSVIADTSAGLIESIITIVLIVAVMLSQSLVLTVVALLTSLASVLLTWFVARKGLMSFSQRQAEFAQLSSLAEESIAGRQELKLFAKEAEQALKLAEKSTRVKQITTKAGILGSLPIPLNTLTALLQQLIILGFGSYCLVTGSFNLDLGTLVVFMRLSANFADPMILLSTISSMLLSALASTERIFRMLDSKAEQDLGTFTYQVQEKKNCWCKGAESIPAQGAIVFKDVQFSYVADKPVIRNLSFVAEPKQTIALIGSTGSGKSTVLNLLNRFYAVNQGAITIDGISVSSIKQDSLHQAIAMVMQEVHLFQGTIAENIRFGKLDATREEIERAAKLAHAHQFISKLPGGYDFELTADGQNISLGQRQLISIARATIKDPLILVLDEATSSVDTYTERCISQGLAQLMKRCTVLVVAHRLATVRGADQILVLDQGEVIERGTHSELLAKRGFYYHLEQGDFELS